MRCEWAKSKARGERWAEDVELLVDEMRRVLTFLDWKANWWRKQQHARIQVEDDLAEGIAAYAAKQANINCSLAQSFAEKWYSLLVDNGLPVEWPEGYKGLTPVLAKTVHDVDEQDEDEDEDEDDD